MSLPDIGSLAILSNHSYRNCTINYSNTRKDRQPITSLTTRTLSDTSSLLRLFLNLDNIESLVRLADIREALTDRCFIPFKYHRNLLQRVALCFWKDEPENNKNNGIQDTIQDVVLPRNRCHRNRISKEVENKTN